MLHTKFQGHRPFDAREEDFFKVFTIYGHGGHLGQVTWTIWINFRSPVPRRLYMKFGFNQPSCFRGDVWKCWHTTHIRTTDAYLYYKLTNDPKGSGELKTPVQPSSGDRCLIFGQTLHLLPYFCMRAAKALARLRRCAGSPKSLQVVFVISTIISWAGSYIVCFPMNLCGLGANPYNHHHHPWHMLKNIFNSYSEKCLVLGWWRRCGQMMVYGVGMTTTLSSIIPTGGQGSHLRPIWRTAWYCGDHLSLHGVTTFVI